MELQRVHAGGGGGAARRPWLWGGGWARDLVTTVGVCVRVRVHAGERIIRERYGHRPQVKIQRVLPGVRRRVTARFACSFLEISGHVQRLAKGACHGGNSPGGCSTAKGGSGGWRWEAVGKE